MQESPEFPEIILRSWQGNLLLLFLPQLVAILLPVAYHFPSIFAMLDQLPYQLGRWARDLAPFGLLLQIVGTAAVFVYPSCKNPPSSRFVVFLRLLVMTFCMSLFQGFVAGTLLFITTLCLPRK